MKKIVLILLVLMLGWVCGAEVQAAETHDRPHRNLQLGFDSASAVELRCEREYNSDIALPQSVAAEPVRAQTVRTASCPERQGIKCGVVCGRYGSKVNYLPEYTINLLLTGVGSADYYVYRLRRLII